MTSPVAQETNQDAPRARRRIRFSLRGLLVGTALLCAVVSHVLTSVALRQSRQEARLLRDELGYLTISDPDMLHAIALAPEEGYASKRWRWRLHFPPGRKFRVCYKFTEIPDEGISGDEYEFFSNDVGGESTLSASAVRDPSGGWKLVLNHEAPGSLQPQARWQVITNDSWLTDDASMSWDQAGAETTESVDAGEPLVLLRMRRTKSINVGGTTGITVDSDPTDGVMIWIEEAAP
jgi:hypothetical protein